MTRVAVIAGAGGGGTATGLELGGRGYHVVLLDSRAESADAAVAAVVSSGGSAEGHALDLLDLPAVAALRDDLVARHGGIDVLVHLVGGWRGSKGLEAAAAENWFALNPPIVGTLATLTSVMGDDLRASDAGRAVMVTSTATSRPTAGNIAYVAAKSAAEAWMAGVADAFAASAACSVVVAVKALLTDAMVEADPGREWPGYTHVRDLASAIADACTGPVDNGARLDLTAAGYSGA